MTCDNSPWSDYTQPPGHSEIQKDTPSVTSFPSHSLSSSSHIFQITLTHTVHNTPT